MMRDVGMSGVGVEGGCGFVVGLCPGVILYGRVCCVRGYTLAGVVCHCGGGVDGSW